MQVGMTLFLIQLQTGKHKVVREFKCLMQLVVNYLPKKTEVNVEVVVGVDKHVGL